MIGRAMCNKYMENMLGSDRNGRLGVREGNGSPKVIQWHHL